MLWDTYEMQHHILSSMSWLSLSRKQTVPLVVMMKCMESTYEVLTYDILLEQAGFKSFKLFADFEDKEPTGD